MSTPSAEPWRALPSAVADVIEPELPAMTTEILATIAREVPEYARPLEGPFGRGVRTGVTEALRQFVALIRDPDAGRERGRQVYRGLGRGEFREGRTLDALQSAYRVGARVAWRREAAAARRAGLGSEVLSVLAESIFAYIDELSADSVEGYAEAQSQVEGERQRRRSDLIALLVRDPPAEEPDIRLAAQAIGWTLPRSAAVLAYAESDLGRVARRLPADALVASRDGMSCAVIPDPIGPGRGEQIGRAVGELPAALGPAAGWQELAESWSLAQGAFRALEAGGLAAKGLVHTEQHLADLMLFQSRSLLERVAVRRLGAFAGLTAKARARMEQTALAYVRNQGNAAAMARALHVHPQTARYRLARLRELLGDDLDDPDARFELEAALRATARISKQ